MKLQLLCIAGILTVSMLALRSDAETPATPSDLSSENAALKAQIAELQKEVADLKAQLAVSQNLGNLHLKMHPFALPPDLNGKFAPNGSQAPPDSLARQFNGMTYYLVPIHGDASAQP